MKKFVFVLMLVLLSASATRAQAPSAPTIVATPGHKRVHLAITFPSGSNSVTIYRGTSPGGENFSTPVKSNWHLPYFDDRGLSNGTTYYYVAKANLNEGPLSSASSETSATATANQLPAMPAYVAFALGYPVINRTVMPAGDVTLSSAYDAEGENEALKWGTVMPKRNNYATIAGTVEVTNGGRCVVGTGTTFLSDYRATGYIRITDSGGANQLYQIRYVYSDTRLDLETPWTQNGASGLAHRPWGNDEPNDADRYLVAYSYYDTALTLYHWYYRTGNPYFLQLAREAADSFYEYFHAYENVGEEHNHIPARHTNCVGLMVRAVDGQPDWWPTITDYVSGAWYIWVTRRIAYGYDDTREQAYTTQYGAVLAYLHPDAQTRATWKSKVETDYQALWMVQQNKYPSNPVPRLPSTNGLDPSMWRGKWVYHFHQPFIDGLWAESAFMVWQLTYNADIKSSFLAYAARLSSDYENRLTMQGFRGRFMYYGEWASDEPNTGQPPNVPSYTVGIDSKIASGGTQGAQAGELAPRASPEPVHHPMLDSNAYANMSDSRMTNSIPLAAVGYAYYLTGDSTYLQLGDDMAKAEYGNSLGVEDDGYWAWPAIRWSGKNHNEAFRRTPTYWAYRDVIAPTGTTTPPAAPTNLRADSSYEPNPKLHWTDNATNETGFKVEGLAWQTNTWVEFATVGANVTTYNITPGKFCLFRVRAYNAVGNSAYSSEESSCWMTDTGLTVENVVWTNISGVTASGNSIAKSINSYYWDAGAVSTRAIASGNGYVEITPDNAGTYRMFGLSNGDSGPGFTDIDFALALGEGSLAVYENGNYRGQVGTYVAGDRLRVTVEDGVVKYYKNVTTLLYTSTVSPTFPLLLDTSISTGWGNVTNAKIAGTSLQGPVTQPVVWTNLSGVTASGNSIFKSINSYYWDAGAVSNKAIASGDGYVEITPGDAGTYRMFGLSNGDSNPVFTDIDFAMALGEGSLAVYENGNYRGQVGTYVAGDKLRVSVEGGVVKYYKNGSLLYTSTVAPVYPLLLDTSISTGWGSVMDAYISGTLTP